jgi:DNA-binding response OmpR family regulator
MRVLLVEDNRQAEKFVWSVLVQRWWGRVSMDCSSSLSQALDLLRTDSFDLVIVDMGVSDLQSPDALLRVSSALPQVPIILMIDEVDTDDMLTNRHRAIHNWVTKDSLTPSRLAEVIRSALDVSIYRTATS